MRAFLLVALLAAPTLAFADDVEKRAMPDYDGRGPAPTDAGDVAIWVPRLAVAPLYLASEYVVRRPMEKLVVAAEAGHWPDRLIELFTFDPERKTGIVPSFYFERGFHPSGGFYFFADDLFTDGTAMRVFGSFGPGHHELGLSEKLTTGAWTFGLRGQWSFRDDYVFYGEGPTSNEADIGRYGLRRLEAAASVSAKAAREVTVGLEVGARDIELSSSDCCDDPSVDLAPYPTPTGFAEGGSTGPFAKLTFGIDTRPPSPAARTGLLVDADAEIDADPRTGRSWMLWGGSVGATWDIGGRHRVLGVSMAARFADGLDGADVPFHDLVTIGGSGPLRGFSAGRLTGRSSLAATAVYEWPVAVWIDGVAHVAAGDVFGEHLDGFRPELLRMSTGIGLRARGDGHRFELLVALGTRTFDEGAGVDSVRLVIGGTRMF